MKSASESNLLYFPLIISKRPLSSYAVPRHENKGGLRAALQLCMVQTSSIRVIRNAM